MLTVTFEARVEQGRLCLPESLAAFEGQSVQVTVTARTPAAPAPDEEPDPEPPDWLDVERDVYVKMPLRGETLHDVVVVEGGPRQPTVILPELPIDEPSFPLVR